MRRFVALGLLLVGCKPELGEPESLVSRTKILAVRLVGRMMTSRR